MAVLVVGGTARKVGKTSLVAGLIAAMPERRWLAVKITQCHHGGDACHCELGGASMALTQEFDSAGLRDTGRYLAAGAERAFWLRTRPGGLAAAMPRLQELLGGAENAVIESNSVLEFLRPDLYLCVVGGEAQEAKASASRFLHRADALIAPKADGGATVGGNYVGLERVPRFDMTAGQLCSDELAGFVRKRLAAASARCG